MLGDNGEQSYSQGVRVGHVAADEVDSRVAQGENEPRISRKPIQLRNQQGHPHPPGLGNGGQQLGPLVLLAALDFDVLAPELARVGSATNARTAARWASRPRPDISCFYVET